MSDLIRVTCRFCSYSFDAKIDSPQATSTHCTFCLGLPPSTFAGVDENGRALCRLLAYFFNKLRDSLDDHNRAPKPASSNLLQVPSNNPHSNNRGPSPGDVDCDKGPDRAGVDYKEGATEVLRTLSETKTSNLLATASGRDPTGKASVAGLGPGLRRVLEQLNSECESESEGT